jgi:predicted RNA-binding protein with RPS1 domain
VTVPTLAQTLQRLALTLTVKDLMVTTERLTCSEREKDAPAVSAENLDFNVIPIKKRGRQITGYYERDSGLTKPIMANDLISDGTSILDLLSTLEKRPFCFVLTHAEIAGYVHFSDLNHPFVKLALYTIIEAIETSALAMISSVLDDQNPSRLGRLLTKIKQRSEKAQKRDANRSWADFLNIEDTLRIAVKENKMHLNEQEIKAITGMRNKVSHQGTPLVKDFKGAIELARIAGRCVQLLDAA